MYEMRMRIRYSEVDRDCRLTWTALLDYFQDCSVAHSQECGLGMDYLIQNRMAWVLAFWQVVRERTPVLGDEVVVQTWPYDFKGMYGFRNFVMKGTEGTVYAFANSAWVLMDLERGCPMRIQEDFARRYGSEERFPMEYRNRKLPVPEMLEAEKPFVVPGYFIDTNGHMNNEKYVLAAQEYLPDGVVVREVCAEYRKSVREGSVLYPMTFAGEEMVTVRFNDEAGATCAVVVFFTANT